mmetsp:Transcript_31589/g.97600  ORF Transcript_31589/g.97600 Transcript_31589/m.97600 type:complete len:236 (-) Transcript_31589:217-924(-)
MSSASAAGAGAGSSVLAGCSSGAALLGAASSCTGTAAGAASLGCCSTGVEEADFSGDCSVATAVSRGIVRGASSSADFAGVAAPWLLALLLLSSPARGWRWSPWAASSCIAWRRSLPRMKRTATPSSTTSPATQPAPTKIHVLFWSLSSPSPPGGAGFATVMLTSVPTPCPCSAALKLRKLGPLLPWSFITLRRLDTHDADEPDCSAKTTVTVRDPVPCGGTARNEHGHESRCSA